MWPTQIIQVKFTTTKLIDFDVKLGVPIQSFLARSVAVFTRTLSFQSHDTVKIRNTSFTATTKNLVMPKSSLKIIITRGHKRIQNPIKHLRWSVLQKYLLNISRELFLQNASSQIFNRVLNTPGLPVNGLYIDIAFSTSNQC